MNKTPIQIGMLCANEFALAIALTVFILITAILILLLVCLAASKNFRTVFFREKPQKRKSGKKQTHTAALSEPQSQGVDTVPIAESTPKRRQPARKADAEPEYLNAIPTVPLGGIPTPAPAPQRPRASRRSAASDDSLEAVAQESGSTYTTRSITITRARSNRIGQSANSVGSRNDKKK